MKLKNQSPVCELCGYDERSQNAPNQLPVGTLLKGQYQVGKALGQGGFGITYLGWDVYLNIPVAIKEYYPSGVVSREASQSLSVSLTGSADALFAQNRARFLREAQTLAMLEDVSEVVQVKNFFQENNTAYIIMGYVKGINLKEHMHRKGGTLSVQETFRLLKPLMEALQQVHDLGLVHRDISPDNIMVQPNGKVRLIDFGAAHEATQGGDNAKSTQAVLKYGFAPIEQYQRKGTLGPWTDVYAFCATIYHCLTGKLPPHATDRVMGTEDFEWDNIPGLTRNQIQVLRQGLELHYQHRIQSMAQLCSMLFAEPEADEELPATVAHDSQQIQPEIPASVVTLPLSRDPEMVTVPIRNSQEVYTAPILPDLKTSPISSDAAPVSVPTIPVKPETFEAGTAVRSNSVKKWLPLAALLLVAIVFFAIKAVPGSDEELPPTPAVAAPTERAEGQTAASEDPSVGITITVQKNGTNVYPIANRDRTPVCTLNKGTQVTIRREIVVDGVRWALISEGWVTTDSLEITETAVIGKDDTQVYPVANESRTPMGTLDSGTVVTIHQQIEIDGVAWTRIDEGWITSDCLE